jgi:hypothetical protein
MRTLIGIFCTLFLSHAAAQDGLIIATGYGAADLTKIPLQQQALVMAKRAAQVDAQRNLAEQIKGLKLTAGTTMEDFEVSSDIVATRVKGIIRGAFELDSITTKDADSILVEVKMAVCVNAVNEKCKNRPTLEDVINKINSKD